jgi:hypothetical protein
VIFQTLEDVCHEPISAKEQVGVLFPERLKASEGIAPERYSTGHSCSTFRIPGLEPRIVEEDLLFEPA